MHQSAVLPDSCGALIAPGCVSAKIVIDPQDVARLLTSEFTRPQKTLHIEVAGGVLGRRTTAPALGVPAATTGVATAVVHIQIAVIGVRTDLEALAQRHIHTKAGAVGAQVVVVVENRRLISAAVAAESLHPGADAITLGQIQLVVLLVDAYVKFPLDQARIEMQKVWKVIDG